MTKKLLPSLSQFHPDDATLELKNCLRMLTCGKNHSALRNFVITQWTRISLSGLLYELQRLS